MKTCAECNHLVSPGKTGYSLHADDCSIGNKQKNESLKEKKGDKKIFRYECFSETLEFAESLGWKEDKEVSEQKWNSSTADGLENDAIEFIMGEGYTIINMDT